MGNALVHASSACRSHAFFHRINSGSTFARKLGILRHCRTRGQQQRANCYHYFLLHITVNVFCFHLIIINALVCPSVEDEHIKDGEKAFLYSKAAQYTIITIKMSQKAPSVMKMRVSLYKFCAFLSPQIIFPHTP